MGKNSKKSIKNKKSNSAPRPKVGKQKKSKNSKFNSKYKNYITLIPRKKKLYIKNSLNAIVIINRIRAIFNLLSNYFSKDSLLSKNSLDSLNSTCQNVTNDRLFADFGRLLTPMEFETCFISYIKKSITNKKVQSAYNSSYNFTYENLFRNLQTKNLNEFLFNNTISSYIRQDIVLSIFDYNDKINSFANILIMNDERYSKIDKNYLIKGESLEYFKKSFLFSNCIMNAIKITLNKFIENINEEKIKDTIDKLLNKINFYYGDIDNNFSAISFLGYNIVIRSYFNNFKNNKIKTVLRNMISHEIIHLLLIELTDNNFFNTSFERSKQQIDEFFENILFGVNIKFYSSLLISYLDNFDNYKKSLSEFNKEIKEIYNVSCLSEEKKVNELTDEECIQMGIIRNIINNSKTKNNNNDNCFGHCRKYYIAKARIKNFK